MTTGVLTSSEVRSSSRSSFGTRCNFRFIQISDSDLDVFSSTSFRIKLDKWLARFYQLSYFLRSVALTIDGASSSNDLVMEQSL